MSVEIERKFLPAAVPAEEMLGQGEPLRQGYLADDGDTSVRVRITQREATLTVKAGSGLSRTEVELQISGDDAEALWIHTAGRRIEKTRHRVSLPECGDLVAEVDVYGGPLAGLCTVEVEFESAAAASSFVEPAWFGTDVTGRGEWSNASLARHGRPA